MVTGTLNVEQPVLDERNINFWVPNFDFYVQNGEDGMSYYVDV